MMNMNRGAPPPRHGGSGGYGGRDNRRPPGPLPQLPPDYLKNGYFDDKGNIRGELITDTAERTAKILGNSKITYLQIRRFFTQVRSIEREMGTRSFQEVVVRIQALKPLVANFVGRGSNPYERQARENLKKFIDCNVDLSVKDEPSFVKGFIPHFEGVIAYFKYHFPSK